ncbi:MAG: hypothetical protein A3G76_12555 [Acidobacteria bacterium RIFCSPLOWO2_12_FULL_65_11]|nr:MAG: hypothetical protein A3H95_13920 [Acidobacteria bacterium RIFCSPLOWO2_02_FULL_64_15]OFW34400.1 MAG: hypothetical protein A3G76_12555 [Acidobacteria bacterium RIFCSPLOWO2_12_FULL_65_11]
MQPRLTFARLAELLQLRFGCTRITLLPPGAITEADGAPTPALYAFVRTVEGVQREAVVHVFDESWPVMDDMLRYICDRLQIAVDDLGDAH